MINDINDLARHRRFISFLATGKPARLIARGGGGHANFTKNSGSTPPPPQATAKTTAPPAVAAAHDTIRAGRRKRGSLPPNQLNAATISAITLSNALAILSLPTLATLPKSLDAGPDTARYERLLVLWSQWQSNARAIGNAVWVRHTNTHRYAIEQYDLTESIMNEFKQYESHYV